MPNLDFTLGPGAHVQIRSMIGHQGTHPRPYVPDPFVAGHAQTLRNAGASESDARAMILDFCRTVPTNQGFSEATALAAGLLQAHWLFATGVRSLVATFKTAGTNPNNFTGAQWAQIGAVLPANSHVDTAAFAKVQGPANAPWTAVSARSLAQAYTAPLGNPNNYAIPEWLQLAAVLPANAHADTAAFARVRGQGNAKWNHANALQLAQARAAGGGNPNNFTGAEWLQLAAVLPANAHADTAAFARVRGQGNTAWNAASAVALAQAHVLGGGNPNNFTVAEWVQIAGELPANDHASTIAFARMQGRNNAHWNAASVVALVQARRAANPRNFSVAEWIALAALLGANQHANTTSLARAPGGAMWNHALLVTLATRFGANAFGQPVTDWMNMGARMANFGNWDLFTERAMRYRQLGWPDSVAILNGLAPEVWHLQASNDGVIYRLTGRTNPHITLHQVDGGPHTWRGHGADLHVVTGGANSPWDHNGRNYTPFLAPKQARPIPTAVVVAVVNSFCTAMGF